MVKMKFSLVSRVWIGLVTIFALAHPVLRWPGFDFFTPIRIIIIIGFLSALRNRRVQVSVLILIALLVLEIAKSILLFSITYEQLIFITHFILLAAFLLVLGRFFVQMEERNALTEVIEIIVLVSTFVIISSIFEYLMGWSWPNTESGKGVSSVFYNVNDYSAFLVGYVAMVIVCLESGTCSVLKKIFYLSGSLVGITIIIINESRAALAGAFLIFLFWAARLCASAIKNSIVIGKFSYVVKKQNILIFICSISCVILGLTISLWGQNTYQFGIEEAWNKMTVAVSTAVWHITHLEYTGVNIGSINDRINAAVFTFKNLLESFGLGIGLGRSKEMIVASGITYNASSLHFFALQMLVELGVIGLLFMYYVVNHTCDSPRDVRLMGRFFAISILIFAGASQSEGFVSNFGAWGVMLYLFFFWRPDVSSRYERQRQAKPSLMCVKKNQSQIGFIAEPKEL